MKILVTAAFNADSDFAHAINTIKMADGFAKIGLKVILVCRTPKEGKLDEYKFRNKYGLNKNLKIIFLKPCAIFRRLNDHEYFAFQVKKIAKAFNPDVVYCRNYVAPALLAKEGFLTIAESHAHPGNETRPLKKMISGLRRYENLKELVTIAPKLSENFSALGVPKEKINVLPDAVDLSLFKPNNRKKNKKDKKQPIALYSGHLYDYKGIPTILESAILLQEVRFQLLGGNEVDLNRIQQLIKEKNLENVELLGWVAHSEVAQHLWNADILLLPPSAKHPSAHWTSPVKLGEYLASGVPVLATAIPALEYWLTNDEVYFVEADSGDEMAKGIRFILENQEYARNMTQRASKFAQELSYENRCKKILNFAGIL